MAFARRIAAGHHAGRHAVSDDLAHALDRERIAVPAEREHDELHAGSIAWGGSVPAGGERPALTGGAGAADASPGEVAGGEEGDESGVVHACRVAAARYKFK